MWRRLLVTYPDVIVAHTRQQTCYFDDAGLLRRLGYAVDILGGGPRWTTRRSTASSTGSWSPPAGSTSATRRHPVRDSVSIAIDIANVTFS